MSRPVRRVSWRRRRSSARGLLAGQVHQHLESQSEEDGVLLAHGLVGDVLGNHRLAQPLGRDEADVASALHEVQAQGGLDGLAVNLLGPGQSKSAMGLKRPRRLRSCCSSSATCSSNWAGAPAGLGGAGDEVIEGARGGVQAEGGEAFSEGRRHWPPPGCRRAGALAFRRR